VRRKRANNDYGIERDGNPGRRPIAEERSQHRYTHEARNGGAKHDREKTIAERAAGAAGAADQRAKCDW
jgi:hypothetical protein